MSPKKLLRRNGDGQPVEGPISGTARLGKRTKDLVKRLEPGDIAIIDHLNIDRVAAEDLIKTGVLAVVNASESTNGRYPNAGPLMLVRAGIVLIDVADEDPFEVFKDGTPVTVDGGTITGAHGESVSGRVLELDHLEHLLEQQKQEIDHALAAFAENTVAHMQAEGGLLAEGLELPDFRTDFRDRHVLIVVRGPTHRRDLRALRAYIRDVKPILVGVDGGADAICEAGHRPDMILGDMDSARDETLRCGAELVVHAYPDGRAPGASRLEEMGLEHKVIPAPGTSQDVAMLAAYEKGAALIVSVGAHFNLIEFLDKNREGMASTFLTRLRIGEVLVDAKGVGRLYNPGLELGPLLIFMGAFLLLLIIVIFTSTALVDLVELLWLEFRVRLGLL
jgi:uncharacterized membrane-anchored protein